MKKSVTAVMRLTEITDRLKAIDKIETRSAGDAHRAGVTGGGADKGQQGVPRGGNGPKPSRRKSSSCTRETSARPRKSERSWSCESGRGSVRFLVRAGWPTAQRSRGRVPRQLRAHRRHPDGPMGKRQTTAA